METFLGEYKCDPCQNQLCGNIVQELSMSWYYQLTNRMMSADRVLANHIAADLC